MIVFRLRTIAVTTLLVLVAGAALAQDTTQPGETRLRPGPDASSPAGNNGPQTPAGAAPSIGAEPGEVSVSALGSSIDGPTIGLLDDANGGLGRDMWIGSPRAELETELSRIPIVTTDPVVRELARRVLLTRADPPLGPAHRALVTIRLERLLDAGLIDEAGALAAQAQLTNDPEFARAQAEALLYAARDADVCSDKTAARLESGDAFWMELRAYCYAATGDAASADLTRSILAAQGTNDTAFDVLLDDVEQNQRTPPGPLSHPNAIDIFLLRKLDFPVTTAMASQLGTAANLLAAADPKNPPIERLSAAEHIATTGAIGADLLLEIADAQSFTSEQKANAVRQAASLPFLTRQILLRQTAALEARPAEKFAVIRRADPMLNEGGPFHTFAVLEAANTMAAEPRGVSGEESWLAARILLLSGHPSAAPPWLGASENPLIALAGVALDLLEPGPANDSLAQNDLIWLADHSQTEQGGWPAATALAVGVWTALGRPLAPDAQKEPVPQAQFDGELLSQSDFVRINRAASDPHRRGEAILDLIDAIGAKGPARFAPPAAGFLVSVLERLQFDSSARQLAAECLLLGPPRPATPPATRPASQGAQP